jgi:hypothetical protein
MHSLSTSESPRRSRPLLRARACISLALSLGVALFVLTGAACNDTPGPPSGPGDNLINDTMQDAVAQLTQDTGTVPPQGASDAAYGGDGGGYLDAGGSMGYADVNSPQSACTSCTCGMNRGFCLENGVTPTVSGAATDAGLCALASPSTLATGCNPIPDSCPQPTCQCLLDALPLGCYADCTVSLGYFDVYCPHP